MCTYEKSINKEIINNFLHICENELNNNEDDEKMMAVDSKELKSYKKILRKLVDELKTNLKIGLRSNIYYAFLGYTKAGKTTLINHILRKKLLPNAILANTSLTSRICNSDDQDFEVKLQWQTLKEEKSEFEFIEAINLKDTSSKLEKIYDDIRSNILESQNRYLEIQIKNLSDLTNLPVDIHLIDTAGLSDKKICSDSTKNFMKVNSLNTVPIIVCALNQGGVSNLNEISYILENQHQNYKKREIIFVLTKLINLLDDVETKILEDETDISLFSEEKVLLKANVILKKIKDNILKEFPDAYIIIYDISSRGRNYYYNLNSLELYPQKSNEKELIKVSDSVESCLRGLILLTYENTKINRYNFINRILHDEMYAILARIHHFYASEPLLENLRKRFLQSCHQIIECSIIELDQNFKEYFSSKTGKENNFRSDIYNQLNEKLSLKTVDWNLKTSFQNYVKKKSNKVVRTLLLSKLESEIEKLIYNVIPKITDAYFDIINSSHEKISLNIENSQNLSFDTLQLYIIKNILISAGVGSLTGLGTGGTLYLIYTSGDFWRIALWFGKVIGPKGLSMAWGLGAGVAATLLSYSLKELLWSYDNAIKSICDQLVYELKENNSAEIFINKALSDLLMALNTNIENISIDLFGLKRFKDLKNSVSACKYYPDLLKLYLAF